MTPKQPVFVARDGYRLRRAMDAARLLPLLGIFLFALPLLWGDGFTHRGIVYIFAVWIGLIIGAAILSRRLVDTDKETRNDPVKEPGDGSV